VTQNLNESELKLFKKWLKGCLAFGPVKVTFIKKDGTERVMECTLAPSLIPAEPVHETNTDNPIDFPAPKREKKINEDTCPVYDMEAKGWRSFRWDSVKQVTLTI
jgi:hypothetical protein